MTSNGSWPAGQATTTDQPFANMDAIGEQDFANLLDFESFDFLTTFDANGENAQKMQNSVDLNLLANAANQQAQHEGQQQQRAQVSSQAQNLFDMQMQMNFAQAQHQHQHGQQYSMPPNQAHTLQTHSIVPPTPNSVEMHGDVRAYLQQLDAQTRAIIEHEYKMRQQESMNFTPLGTPAVTPHDAQFNPVNQFAVPGEYFSPLVSPALEGQQQRGQQTAASTASTASPVDFDVDMLGESAVQQVKQPRKARRQSITTRNGSGNRKVAQSPIQKPAQKRRSGLSSVIPPKEVTELLEMHAQTRHSPTSPSSARMGRAYASSSESISPEPLSEGLMRPPPKPHSAKSSPAIAANSKSPTVGPNGVGSMPATPASLMRINPKESPSGVSVPSTIPEQGGDDIPMLDDLILPEAAAPATRSANLPKIDTAAANGDATPRVSARKGPRSATLQASTPTTAKLTPTISSAASPISGVASPVSSRRPDPKGRAGSKKRGSMGDRQLISPALLPRISPSIKPLLPEGEKLTEEQHALLLTSRSNYQNLIEGRNIPGVTYPSDLPSQLTSKRTSHKIAEQGRRQRINVALQEMQGLLPKMSPMLGATKIEEEDDDDDDEPGGGKKKGGKGGGNSKAATVENAIVYIRAMQDKERVWQQERDEREREVEVLRKKLDALERRLSTSKSPQAVLSSDEAAGEDAKRD